MTIHRFIPASLKHGDKTSCGIELKENALPIDATELEWKALDGAPIAATVKGQPFDCSRCRRVLEIRHHANPKL